MGQYLSWLANGVLFVLCCYLLADSANDVFAALLTPKAQDATAAPVAAAPVRRGWSDREIILKRNLFNASLLAPPAPVVEPEEDLDETQLPLTLLGTAAFTPPELSWAAVLDETARQTVVVRVSDQLKSATVERIERRRIVLLEGGVLRELLLDDDEKPKGAMARRGRVNLPNRVGLARNRNPRSRAGHRERPKPPARPKIPPRDTIEKLAEDRFKIDRDDADDLMQNPANLFSQARILPKFEEGEMVGLQINAIKPGSLFQDIGIESGDVLTKVNGISIDDPQQSPMILRQLSEADTITAEVLKSDGSVHTLEMDVEDLE